MDVPMASEENFVDLDDDEIDEQPFNTEAYNRNIALFEKSINDDESQLNTSKFGNNSNESTDFETSDNDDDTQYNETDDDTGTESKTVSQPLRKRKRKN